MTIANLQYMNQARANLSRFMLAQAEIIAKRVGFGYIDKADAPNGYDSILAAWSECERTGKPFPVWSGGSDKTVYTSCGANFAFRFWHDYLHVANRADCTTADEIKIGCMHVKAVQAEYGKHSLEALIMFADTISQSIYASNHDGNFPSDQLAFVTDCVIYGIARIQADEAINNANRVPA